MWAHPMGGSEQLRGAAIATMEQQLIHGKHQLNSHMLPFFCCRSRAQPPSARILTFLVWQLCWHTDTHRHSYLGSCGPSPTNGEGRARRFTCLMLKSPEDTSRSGFGVLCQTGLLPD